MQVKLGEVLKTADAPVQETQPVQSTETVTAPAAEAQPVAETPVAAPIVNEAPNEQTTPAPATVPIDEVPVFEFPDYTEAQPATPATGEHTQVTSINELLKNTDKKELLKKLGLDDFDIEMSEYRQKGGQASDYINAKGVNWENVPDTDILKRELKNEFPEATSAQIERLFNKKYNQTDSAEDEDKEDGLLLMKADARKIRQQKITEQQKFKMPDATQQQQAQEPDPEAEKAAQQRQQFFNKITQSELTKNLFNSKRVAIQLGEGVTPVSIEVNPSQLLDVLFKPEVAAKIGMTPQGEPDVQFWHEAALFFANPKLFKSLVRGNPRALATKELVEEGQNPSKQAPVVSMNTQQFSSAGEAFNKGQIRQVKLGNYSK